MSILDYCDPSLGNKYISSNYYKRFDEEIKLPMLLEIIILLGVTFSIIKYDVATTFVCIYEDKDALYQTKPELWEKDKDTFPKFVK
ncbi:hypothetical protein BCR32DRAFT_282955 [Anaeromyces robustus]|uniref:Uncharacterized protein n=1 Tax=Anaeromyces robustus TaxID=1754192 RepID=A0A1Y1WVY2_9FUNG|nr:hypothetical protein BCR32DRAFT_282955 [Anaeromyces robustus]|eukprot:ORX77690.1 hypothetical protein BCR32DRAFT_282955 [Anaeromyces robustus]